MRLEWLRCFNEVARTGSFSQAAQNIYLTQPAVTRIIHALEDNVGEKLFIRNNTGVRLTEAGKIFERYAQKTLVNYEQYLIELRAYQNAADCFSGTIELAVSTMLLQTYYQEIVDCLNECFPNVTLRLIEGETAAVIDRVSDNPKTIGFILAGFPLEELPTENGLNGMELYRAESILCASVHSPYIQQMSLVFDKIPHRKLISTENGSKKTVHFAYPRENYNLYTTNLATIKHRIIEDPEACVVLARFIAEKGLLSPEVAGINLPNAAPTYCLLVYNQAVLGLKLYSASFLTQLSENLKNIF